MDAKLRTRTMASRPPLTIDEWFYVYRWGVSPAHLSGVGHDDFWAALGTLPIATGEYTLEPHWEVDYAAMTRAYLFALKLHGEKGPGD